MSHRTPANRHSATAGWQDMFDLLTNRKRESEFQSMLNSASSGSIDDSDDCICITCRLSGDGSVHHQMVEPANASSRTLLLASRPQDEADLDRIIAHVNARSRRRVVATATASIVLAVMFSVVAMLTGFGVLHLNLPACLALLAGCGVSTVVMGRQMMDLNAAVKTRMNPIHASVDSDRYRQQLVDGLDDPDTGVDPVVVDVWTDGVLSATGRLSLLPRADLSDDQRHTVLDAIARERASRHRRMLSEDTGEVADLVHTAEENYEKLIGTRCWIDDFGGIRSTGAEELFVSVREDALSLIGIDETLGADLRRTVVERNDALARLAERARQVDHSTIRSQIADRYDDRRQMTEQMVASTDLWVEASWNAEQEQR